MKTWWKIGVVAVSLSLAVPAAVLYGAEKKESKGAKLFQQHCVACHPDGGNTLNPALTLRKKDRDAHGVMSADAIVGKMRNPGPKMTRYDAKSIPDADAKEIAEYIIKTFK